MERLFDVSKVLLGSAMLPEFSG